MVTELQSVTTIIEMMASAINWLATLTWGSSGGVPGCAGWWGPWARWRRWRLAKGPSCRTVGTSSAGFLRLHTGEAKLFWILLNQTKFGLWLPVFDWFGTKGNSIWFQINWKMVNTMGLSMVQYHKCVCLHIPSHTPPPEYQSNKNTA